MLQNRMRKNSKAFVLAHTVLWFLLGFLVSYCFKIIPGLNQISLLCDPLSMASFLGITAGFCGGAICMMRTDLDQTKKQEDPIQEIKQKIAYIRKTS